MRIFLLILFGILSGVLGGMGMGGGTLFIPLLTLVLGISQQNAQGINLIAFLPMSIFALVLHFKNKLVKWKTALILSSSGLLSAIASSFLANSVNPQKLSYLFGIFLIVMGVIDFVIFIVQQKKNQIKHEPKE